MSRTAKALSAFHSGIWLAFLGRDALVELDHHYYLKESMYRTAAHNESGLLKWEQELWHRFFFDRKSVLLAGAGGGREVLALSLLGAKVDAFECNEELVAWGNAFLRERDCPAVIRVAPRDRCPALEPHYDGAIVGWGAYMLIRGREARIDFLRQIRSSLPGEAPVLLSFFTRSEQNKMFALTEKVANVMRFVGGTQRVETGDALVENFTHYFVEREIRAELDESGFDLAYFAQDGYGRAIGIAR